MAGQSVDMRSARDCSPVASGCHGSPGRCVAVALLLEPDATAVEWQPMSQIDDLMREAHDLAEQMRMRRALPAQAQLRDRAPMATLEAQMARVWGSIRAARAAETTTDPGLLTRPATRPKWG